jgi:TonB family protein
MQSFAIRLHRPLSLLSLLRRRFRKALLLVSLSFAISSPGFGSEEPSFSRPTTPALSQHERQAWRAPVRVAEFSEIPHASVHPSCADVHLPQALTTPDPLLVPAARGSRIKVSFIVGTDGRVHSPLILESAGSIGDRNVLQTVRAWRYRPATCNGVPTETEGEIEFSRR